MRRHRSSRFARISLKLSSRERDECCQCGANLRKRRCGYVNNLQCGVSPIDAAMAVVFALVAGSLRRNAGQAVGRPASRTYPEVIEWTATGLGGKKTVTLMIGV